MDDITIVYPDYYKDFKCIKGECRHNCCIGWEIDIDDETLSYYDSITTPFGKRIRNFISRDDTAHFILDKNERCPFLNKDNLCDIIIELGEEHICDICTEHPRFSNHLPGRIEKGIGLCCEAAGRIILGSKKPVKLIPAIETEDEILLLRDKIISALQNRNKAIPDRISDMMRLCDDSLPELSADDMIEILLKLERLDNKWTDILLNLKASIKTADLKSFDQYMSLRQHEYEQLLVYFIYRHFANAFDLADAASRARFAYLGYYLIHAIGAVAFTQKQCFDFDDQVEIARIFSSEIEYSEDNMDTLLDELY